MSLRGESLTRKARVTQDEPLEVIRCPRCDRLLLYADVPSRVEIVCVKCHSTVRIQVRKGDTTISYRLPPKKRAAPVDPAPG